MMPRRYIAIAAGLAAVAGLAVWTLSGPREPASEARAAAGDTRQGGRLYQQYCAECHGMKRQGQADWRERKPDGRLPAPPLDGTGHTWHHPDRQLLAIITHGVEALAPAGYRSDMAGFGDRLSAKEIRAILDYIKAQWPAEIRARQERITEQAGG